MKKKLLGLLSGLAFALTASVAQAVPMLEGPPTAATGITGLEVSGMEYDVSFSVASSYDDLFGSSTPTFLGDETGAEAVRDAILDVLITNAVTGITNLPTDLVNNLFVPWALASDTVQTKWVAQQTIGADDWTSGATSNVDRATQFTNVSWARFTPVQVPEPATLALLSLGLAGLGFMRRRTMV